MQSSELRQEAPQCAPSSEMIDQHNQVVLSRRLSNAPVYEYSTTINNAPHEDQVLSSQPTHIGLTSIDEEEDEDEDDDDNNDDDDNSEESQEKTEGDAANEGGSCSSKGQQKQGKIIAVILAWVSMAAAIMAGSLIGPAFKVIHESHINTILAASWRSQCMCIVLLPIAVCEYYYLDKSSRVNWFTNVPPGLDYPIIYYTMIAGVLWSANLLLWVVALNWVSTVHAAIFAGMHPIIVSMDLCVNTSEV